MDRRTLLTSMAGLAVPAWTAPDTEAELGRKVREWCIPPAEFARDLGGLRSVLKFDDGTPVRGKDDWPKRRAEILKYWHDRMGSWPEVLERPRFETLGEEKREELTQRRVRMEMAPDRFTEGYLLLPPGDGPFPGVVTVYYEPETAIGKGMNALRDFAYLLAKRGFAALSIGFGASLYYPSQEAAQLQPLSANAYVAANAYHALANQPRVDPKRIGIVGHSYGGKWALFASCLYDRFAAAAWSDPGVVFDETRSNVNYWEPWYLGYERGFTRKRGVITPESPRTGAYKRIVEEGHDLHELHVLMAPRPFLVSGGAEDPPLRWKALNYSVAVNQMLGYQHRVALTSRPAHTPTPESNEQIYQFFQYFLRPPVA